jgi:hypothetical protein
MGVGGQLHTLACLPRGKSLQEQNAWEAGGTPKSAQAQWRTEDALPLLGIVV